MTRRAWVRLDNASNIFLAARSDADPKVFRISAEMDHDVDPQLLQEALDATYDRYRLYHAVLRSGVFWYYLQDSDLRPLVTAEELPTCAPIYQADRRTLLFRVMHHRRRISLEVFHALSDGTGASWFLSDLVTAYVGLRHPESDHPLQDAGGIFDPRTPPGRREPGDQAGDDAAEQARELTGDSFAHYFRRRRRPRLPASESAFGRAAAPAVPTELAVRSSPDAPREPGRSRRAQRTKVHRIRGTRTPDNRTRVVELTMPTAEVLALARAEGVALTMYLTAVFFESVRRSSGGLTRTRTVAASVPVNLRQFFPSTSPRNFFATTRVEHTYGAGADDLGSICRQLESQFRPKSTPEALEEKLRRFLRFERMPVLRIVPRPLKDVILKLVNHGSNRSLTIAVSNLGLRGQAAAQRRVPRRSAHAQLHLAVHRDRPHPGIRPTAQRQRGRGDGRRRTGDRDRARGAGTMRRCTECAVDIEGSWSRCPLCTAPVAGQATASPLPAVPLRFSRRRVLRVLFLASIAVILASFVVQLLLSRGLEGIGALRSVWLGLITMWLVVLMAVRKRRNVAKGTVYLVVLVDLVCVYWDYLTGWRGWSLTYAVPIVSACSIVALLITVRVMRIEVGEHILYSGLTVLLGLAPIVFLALGWVNNPVPSATCGALSLVTLVLMQLARGPDVRHELAKRLHL